MHPLTKLIKDLIHPECNCLVWDTDVAKQWGCWHKGKIPKASILSITKIKHLKLPFKDGNYAFRIRGYKLGVYDVKIERMEFSIIDGKIHISDDQHDNILGFIQLRNWANVVNNNKVHPYPQYREWAANKGNTLTNDI